MKIRKSVFAPIGCFALLAAFGTVGNDDNDGEHLRTHLIGWQEVPAIASSGTAVFRAKIADDDLSFQWEMTYSGLTDVKQSHIHVGQRGVAGAVVIFLCTNLGNAAPPGITVQACPSSAGTLTGTATAANVIGVAAQGVAANSFTTVLDAIRAGVAYVNIHTTAHPGGEIRGQLTHAD